MISPIMTCYENSEFLLTFKNIIIHLHSGKHNLDIYFLYLILGLDVSFLFGYQEVFISLLSIPVYEVLRP